MHSPRNMKAPPSQNIWENSSPKPQNFGAVTPPPFPPPSLVPSDTITTERNSVGKLLLASRKAFQAGGRHKTPTKASANISTTEFFPLWHLFVFAKGSSSLEQGGVWFPFLRTKLGARRGGGTLRKSMFLSSKHLLSACYEPPPSKNPCKNLCPCWKPYKMPSENLSKKHFA